MFARAFYHVHGEERDVYACDSFHGMPAGECNSVTCDSFLSASVEEVRDNFESFGLFDDRVHFWKGLFKSSLPPLQSEMYTRKKTISVLHLDGDLYESYMDALFNLYELVSDNGFIIAD